MTDNTMAKRKANNKMAKRKTNIKMIKMFYILHLI